MSEIGIFIDFGSTYTKVVAIDLNEERIIGQGRSASTVTTDITTGLKWALEKLETTSQTKCVEESRFRLACSSAAGGLRLAVIGLVPNLSLNAGRYAALGAGAKLVGNYSYKLNQSEVSQRTTLTRYRSPCGGYRWRKRRGYPTQCEDDHQIKDNCPSSRSREQVMCR